MNHDASNPYAAPQVDSVSNQQPSAANAIDGLRERNIWLMLLLTIVTLGLYINYWTHRYALLLKQNVPRAKVSMGAVWLYWIVSITSLLWTIPEIVYDTTTMVQIGQMLSRVDLIFSIVMAFAVRGGLNTWGGSQRGGGTWFHGLWTFLFGFIYLQWKVNRLLRQGDWPLEKSASNSASFDFLSAPASSTDAPPTVPITNEMPRENTS